MSSDKPKSLQDVLKARRKAASSSDVFGRGEEIARFRESLTRPPEERPWFLFNAHGQGGVGKTFLLRHLQQLAQEQGALSAWSDHEQKSSVDILAKLSDELRSKGISLKSFDDRYRTYRQKRKELETDPEMPRGFYDLLGKTVTQTGLWAGQALGLGFVLPFGSDELASRTAEGIEFIVRKLKKDDVELLLEPVKVLTQLWVNDLREACERHSIVLFFDGYERTAPFLDPWLRDVLRGDHGKTPLNLLFVVAGQLPLPLEAWRDFEDVISWMPLEPFTEQETRAFLSQKGIQDEQAAEDVFHKTRGLPVLVALFATERSSAGRVAAPHEDAIRHFLNGVEPRHRQVALDAALPRLLNRDVLAVLTGPDDADAFFDWLKQMPFVDPRSNGWEYHDVVRFLMFEYKRQESPEGWARLHRSLGGHYERRRSELGLSPEQQFQDGVWCELTLEVLYHRVCESRHRVLGFALDSTLAALKHRRALAEDWADTLAQAEEDTDIPAALQWGPRFLSALESIEAGQFSEAIATFTALLEREDLQPASRAIAFNWRGYLRSMSNQLEEAVADLTEAIALAPDDHEHLADRGRILLRLQRYAEALVDLDKAIERNSRLPAPFITRGLVLTALGRYEQAKADAERVMALAPQSAAGPWLRLIVVARMGNQAQLVEAYTQLADQAPRYVQEMLEAAKPPPPETAMTEIRGVMTALGFPGGFSERDLQKPIALLRGLSQGHIEPVIAAIQAEAAALQSQHQRKNLNLQAALLSIEQAITRAPNDSSYLLTRAELRVELGLLDEAREDFDQAAAIAPESAIVFRRRGDFHLSRQNLSEALAAFSRAIELEPDSHSLIQRSTIHRLQGNHPQALADLEHAAKLTPGFLWPVFYQLPIYIFLQDFEGMARTCARLAEKAPQFVQQLKEYVGGLDAEQRPAILETFLIGFGFMPADFPGVLERLLLIAEADEDVGIRALQSDAAASAAFLHKTRGELTEALAELARALSLDPSRADRWLQLADLHQRAGRNEEALADIERILTLGLTPPHLHLHLFRAELYLRLNQPDAALAAVDQELALHPQMAQARVMRSEILARKQRHNEALEEVTRALVLEPDMIQASALRCTLCWIQERYAEALEDLEKVVASGLIPVRDWPNERGELLARMGKYEDALVVYRQALEQAPGNWRAEYNLITTRARLEGTSTVGEELAELQGHLRSALAEDRAEAMARLGGLEALTESPERAFEFLKEALALDFQVIHWAKGDLAWGLLKNHPRFQELLQCCRAPLLMAE